MEKENKTYAPVVAFAYNRADKIIRCLTALSQNPEAKETDLFIYSDGPKSEAGASGVKETRDALKKFKVEAGFKSVTIIEAERNKGLATSIMDGVTEVVNKHGKAIIVEDDLLVSKKFLSYMNGALDYYADNHRIGAISGYTYPLKELENYDGDVYVMHKGDCWGWATWKDRWDNASWGDVDFDAYLHDKKLRRKFENTENGWDLLMILLSQGKTSSWAVRWVLYLLKNDLWTVYPKESFVSNAGFDGSGIHSNKSEEVLYYRPLSDDQKEVVFKDVTPNEKLERQAAVHPRRGFVNGSIYWMKRVYVHLFNLRIH